MTIKQKNFVSAVVYVCNMEDSIERFLNMLYDVLVSHFETFEIICANDASTDDSKDVIQRLSDHFPNCVLSIVNMGYYQGVEATMNAGVDLAIGDFVFEFDSVIVDYDPTLIMQVYNRSLQGFDIVSCGQPHTRVSSRLFYLVYNSSSDAKTKLQSETFRVLSRRAINRVHSMSVNLPYRKALYTNCGLKVDCIHCQSTGDIKKSKRMLKHPHDTALTTLILFTDVAYRTALFFTSIMMFATIGSFGYAITVYILGNPVAGYTTTMALISGAFFALFAILTVVIKYLSVILGLVFHRQKYVVESVEKVATGGSQFSKSRIG